jgi:hypothetical protein
MGHKTGTRDIQMGIISPENIERDECGESGVSGMIGLTIHGLFKGTARGSDGT